MIIHPLSFGYSFSQARRENLNSSAVGGPGGPGGPAFGRSAGKFRVFVQWADRADRADPVSAGRRKRQSGCPVIGRLGNGCTYCTPALKLSAGPAETGSAGPPGPPTALLFRWTGRWRSGGGRAYDRSPRKESRFRRGPRSGAQPPGPVRTSDRRRELRPDPGIDRRAGDVSPVRSGQRGGSSRGPRSRPPDRPCSR